jgi:hypothetical protein
MAAFAERVRVIREDPDARRFAYLAGEDFFRMMDALTGESTVAERRAA